MVTGAESGGGLSCLTGAVDEVFSVDGVEEATVASEDGLGDAMRMLSSWGGGVLAAAAATTAAGDSDGSETSVARG